ncbi:hypothetical protein ACWGNN_31490 [Streptomyces sp. NPDC055817]
MTSPDGLALPHIKISRRWRRGPHQDRTVETVEIGGGHRSALYSERVFLAAIAAVLVGVLAWRGWAAMDIGYVLGAMGTLLAVLHVGRRQR